MRRIKCREGAKGDLRGDLHWVRGVAEEGLRRLGIHVSSYSFLTLIGLRKGKGRNVWGERVSVPACSTHRKQHSTSRSHFSIDYTHFSSREHWILSFRDSFSLIRCSFWIMERTSTLCHISRYGHFLFVHTASSASWRMRETHPMCGQACRLGEVGWISISCQQTIRCLQYLIFYQCVFISLTVILHDKCKRMRVWL